MAAEHASLLANDVWLLTDLPKGRKAMKSKWIWKVKYLSTGEIERFKACLVIKGFLQIAGKALYGLKQVPRQWHKKLDAFVCTLGFKRCYKDQYIYVLRDADDAVSAYFAVYVDDITLAGKDVAILARLKTCTEGQFAITDTGELDFLLGIKIQRDRQARTLYMHQNLFIQDLLARFNMAGCHPAPTPQAQGVPTVEAPDTLDVPYQSLVGALQYLVSATRPDIANATHWRLAKRVLKYLSGTSTLGVYYDGRIHSTPIAYSDADFVNDNNTKHIRLQFHFLEDLAADGTLTIQYINTKYSIADILTKGLAQTGFEKLSFLFGLRLLQSNQS
ncbi:hypothetical protein AaE_002676 [Aphanomyces astaci]|uniref:Reverse transcriptase Ty1/copia-type domain-containing protein n=1 Tax=Aphanomyces astaci TaxID=112090 RepID=A0A6A5AY57_APHAT|nr:hypothetical protein AaE_002676 [Aphanomyces astaci]